MSFYLATWWGLSGGTAVGTPQRQAGVVERRGSVERKPSRAWPPGEGLRSTAEHDVNAGEHELQFCARQFAHALGEEGLVDCDCL